jgi:hypothetical protein
MITVHNTFTLDSKVLSDQLGILSLGTPAQVSRAGSQYWMEHATQAGELGLRQANGQLVAVHPTSVPKHPAHPAVRPTAFWMQEALQADAPKQPLAQVWRVEWKVELFLMKAVKS